MLIDNIKLNIIWIIIQVSGRSRISQGCTNRLFYKLFAKNSMKMKRNLDRGGGGRAYLVPPWICNCKHLWTNTGLCVIYVISLEVALHCELKPVNYKIAYSVFVCGQWTWDHALIFLMEQECTHNTAERTRALRFDILCVFSLLPCLLYVYGKKLNILQYFSSVMDRGKCILNLTSFHKLFN